MMSMTTTLFVTLLSTTNAYAQGKNKAILSVNGWIGVSGEAEADEIECKKGEENLLRKAEELLNLNLDNNPHLKKLSQSKKFLMLSLVLAADLSSSKKQFNDDEENFKKVLNELSELEEIIGVKSD